MSLAEKILRGDIRAASRLMRDIDDRMPSAMEELKKIYSKTGNAYIIGITGPPGSGKSTLVDKTVEILRKERKTVGIVAVDPTSPFTGGAILGDRIRMQRHSIDDGVFIRSLATRGSLGGISRSTSDIIKVMDAMGKDIIIVETVGVGQDEVDIVNTAHTSVVVLVPGSGDDIQAIKAGILEIGDIFVINKCERQGADRLEMELKATLEMGPKREDGWMPLIFKTEALLGKGIFELVYGIYRHREKLLACDYLEKKIFERTKWEFLCILDSELRDTIVERLEKDKRLDKIIDDLKRRKANPYSIVEKILEGELKGSS
ncbi:MAG: methylmalonyl Co-A mutase-associated GTPase MeaB [Syntrophobacterales bacterium]|nr:MAG: methylmalonyl Co-A mutase-associated GTPase MeaB [Syntrophobacterales bacterium]